MTSGRTPRSSPIRWGAIAVLVAAGIGVGTLVAAAYGHSAPAEQAGAAAPVPTFTLGVQTPTPTPTPEPFEPGPRDTERFLSVGTGAGANVWWRGIAGACGGLGVVVAMNGVEGVAAVKDRHPLLTMIGVTMPGIDGFETVRRVRAISDTYIVLVSAQDDEADAVLGLSSGADDYIRLPLRPREFRARVGAILRRSRAVKARDASASAVVAAASTPPSALRHRDLTVDTSTRVVRREGADVVLTRTEFELLRTLLESQRRPRTREDLVMVTRGDEPGGSYVSDLDRRAIEAHVTNLRRKLGDRADAPLYIETVRGVGYRLTPAQG